MVTWPAWSIKRTLIFKSSRTPRRVDPEVTRLMNDTDDGLSREQNESKRSFCKRWGDALVEKGLIQKKVDGR